MQLEKQDDGRVAEEAIASLSGRATARRQEMLDNQTITLAVPGYEGILAIEYRAISFQESKRIIKRNSRVREEAERELYIAADHLVATSVESYELMDDGSRRPLGLTWGVSLARALGVEISDAATPRQALFACFPRDHLLVSHFVDYNQWLEGAHADIDQEQTKDFQQTR